MWNGIVAMALPNSIPLFTIPIFFLPPYFGNGIATNQLQQFFSLLFRQYHYHNSIPLFFFFLNKWNVHTIFTIFLQQILSDKSLLLD